MEDSRQSDAFSQEIAKNVNAQKDNSPEALTKAYEKELLDKYGVSSRKDKDQKEHWYYSENGQTKEFDPTGNLDFLKKTMTNVTNYNQ